MDANGFGHSLSFATYFQYRSKLRGLYPIRMKNIKSSRLLFAASGVSLVIASVLFYQAYPKNATLSQDLVPSTLPLTHVDAKDPALSKALDARDLKGLRAQLGKSVTFQGTVTSVFSPRSNKVTALNFAPNFREAIVAVVHSEDYTKFPDLRALSGKHLLISGIVDEHISKERERSLEVRLNDAQQLQMMP